MVWYFVSRINQLVSISVLHTIYIEPCCNSVLVYKDAEVAMLMKWSSHEHWCVYLTSAVTAWLLLCWWSDQAMSADVFTSRVLCRPDYCCADEVIKPWALMCLPHECCAGLTIAVLMKWSSHEHWCVYLTSAVPAWLLLCWWSDQAMSTDVFTSRVLWRHGYCCVNEVIKPWALMCLPHECCDGPAIAVLMKWSSHEHWCVYLTSAVMAWLLLCRWSDQAMSTDVFTSRVLWWPDYCCADEVIKPWALMCLPHECCDGPAIAVLMKWSSHEHCCVYLTSAVTAWLLLCWWSDQAMSTDVFTSWVLWRPDYCCADEVIKPWALMCLPHECCDGLTIAVLMKWSSHEHWCVYLTSAVTARLLLCWWSDQAMSTDVFTSRVLWRPDYCCADEVIKPWALMCLPHECCDGLTIAVLMKWSSHEHWCVYLTSAVTAWLLLCWWSDQAMSADVFTSRVLWRPDYCCADEVIKPWALMCLPHECCDGLTIAVLMAWHLLDDEAKQLSWLSAVKPLYKGVDPMRVPSVHLLDNTQFPLAPEQWVIGSITTQDWDFSGSGLSNKCTDCHFYFEHFLYNSTMW